MSQCSICKENEADKKNAHLIPWFFIKKSITHKGTGLRNTEVSFTITPNDFTKVYQGQSVIPENVKDLQDWGDLQKEIVDPYSRDNLICSKCEDKLSRLEAIFASEFSSKNIKNAFALKLESINGQLLYTRPKYSFALYELLIQSIFYRCSIGKFGGSLLKPSIENKIEENLREAFKTPEFKKLKASDLIPLKISFPIVISILHELETDDTTEGFIIGGISRFPYFIVSGRWIIQLFEEEKQLKNPVERLYGLTTKIRAKEVFDKAGNVPYLILIEKELTKFISKNIIDDMVARKIIGLKKNIRDFYTYKFTRKPNAYIAQYIYQQYFVHLNEGKTESESFILAFLDLKGL